MNVDKLSIERQSWVNGDEIVPFLLGAHTCINNDPTFILIRQLIVDKGFKP